jgi:hypothetical protein
VSVEVTTGYVHRTCKGCGARLKRWIDGRENRAVFCSSSCAAFTRNQRRKLAGGCPGKVDGETRILSPLAQALLDGNSRTEGGVSYVPCKTCGRTGRQPADGGPFFCGAACRDYRPLPPRKAGGTWYVVAGPRSFCSACHLAIEPKADGLLLPHRTEGRLFCDTCAPQPRHRRGRAVPTFVEDTA